jgi:superfamily I DNA and/or RNA helicase
VNLIKGRLQHEYPNIEIGSVDGFQGREKEAIVNFYEISLKTHWFIVDINGPIESSA